MPQKGDDTGELRQEMADLVDDDLNRCAGHLFDATMASTTAGCRRLPDAITPAWSGLSSCIAAGGPQHLFPSAQAQAADVNT